jgi:hypothetical protein
MFAEYGRQIIAIILLGNVMCFLFACNGEDPDPAVAELPPTLARQDVSEGMISRTAVPPTAVATANAPDAAGTGEVEPTATAVAGIAGVTEAESPMVEENMATGEKATEEPLAMPAPGQSRGYQTTPEELKEIKRKADEGIEPYRTAVNWIFEEARKGWNYELQTQETCSDAHNPAWNDNGAGTAALYAKALVYQLSEEEAYAEEVKNILQRIMTEVESIDVNDEQCPLNFAWGAPELVASADLIEGYWYDQECTGPVSTLHSNTTLGSGNCKELFQNWLVKNPYYIVSETAQATTSNWGAAATNATAHIADFLWDRPDVTLNHRNPSQINNGKEYALTAAEAYALANDAAIERMNGYRVEYESVWSCDRFGFNVKQSSEWEPVKSQISEKGIIPEDARRKEYCNIPQYNNAFKHSYPQLHLGNNIQQCELMLRRGDRSCYDNVDNSDIPDYTYSDAFGFNRTTHLYPGRGSIERAINAIIVDAGISWQQDPALEVAYRYYLNNQTVPGVEQWFGELNRRRARCVNHLCFGLLTHGFAAGESPQDPPAVAPPR